MGYQGPLTEARVAMRTGLAQPGKIERGARAAGCRNHLHQLHVCLPAGPGRSRLLYRMSMDFLQWTKHVPFIESFWAHIAKQVTSSDGRPCHQSVAPCMRAVML